MLGKINILVHGSIEEDADDYMGAIIEDYNEAEGILHLFVDPDEIEAGYICEVDAIDTEAWGVTARSEILSINVVDCSWKDIESLTMKMFAIYLLRQERKHGTRSFEGYPYNRQRCLRMAHARLH